MSRTAPHRIHADHVPECDGATVLVVVYDSGEEPIGTYNLSLRAALALRRSLAESIAALEQSILEPCEE